MSADTLFDLPAARRATVGSATVLVPPLKWPGGKSGELDRILAAAPRAYDRYFEPFVGGGAVYWSVPSSVPAWINDTSVDLVDLYRLVQAEDARLHEYLDGIVSWWAALQSFTEECAAPLVAAFEEGRELPPDKFRLVAAGTVKSLINEALASVPHCWDDLAVDFRRNVLKLVSAKMARMRKVETQREQQLPHQDVWANVEGAYKACAYTSLRTAYNVARTAGDRGPRQVALFLYLREFAYAAMFRFNTSGEFNVPYGGITYNRKNFAAKLEHLRSGDVVKRLRNTTIGCDDFAKFLEAHQPGAGSWLFLDPPYDSDFSTYDENCFSLADQRRLRDVLASLDGFVQVVIKATPAIVDLYPADHWNVLAFDKKYMWTIKERNDRNATHLMITNYDAAPRVDGVASGGAGRGA